MELDYDLAKLRRLKIPALLVVVFLIGFSIVYLSHGPRLADPDGWHYYRYVRWIVEDGRLPDHDPFQYYPTGSNPSSDNIVHTYFIGYIYRLIQPLGVPLMPYLMAIEAVVGGGIASVCLYYAVRELFGRRVGLLSAFLYSSAPLMLTRVYSGSIDKEVTYGLFVFTSLYFFLRGYKGGIDLREPKSLINPALGGIFFGLGVASWSGVDYILLAISAAAAVHFCFVRDRGLMKSILVMGLVGSLTMFLVSPPRYTLAYFTGHLQTVIPLAVAFFPLMALWASDEFKRRGRDIPPLYILMTALVLALLLLFPLGFGPKVRYLASNAIGFLSLGKGVRADLYMATVAESQPVSFLGGGNSPMERILSGDLFRNLHLMLFIIPIGCLILLLRFLEDKKNFTHIFALVWVSSGLLAAAQGMRLMFFLAPSAVTVVAFTFITFYKKYREEERGLLGAVNSGAKTKARYKAEERLGTVRLALVLVPILLLLTSLSTTNYAVAMMAPRQSDLPAPWLDALLWTKANTPEDSVILFWWDYGYYFQAVAERRTVADGGGNVPRNIDLAKMFTSPEDEAMAYIRKYVDYTKVPTYMVVSYEEFGKSGAINRIAGGNFSNPSQIVGDGQLYIATFSVPKGKSREEDDRRIGEIFQRNNIATYYIVDMGSAYQIWAMVQVDEQGNYHPEWSEKLLVKLLPFNNGLGQGLKHFKLVYPATGNKFSYVYIYRVQ